MKRLLIYRLCIHQTLRTGSVSDFEFLIQILEYLHIHNEIWRNIGLCEKDALLLKGAGGGSLIPLGVLNKLCTFDLTATPHMRSDMELTVMLTFKKFCILEHFRSLD